MGFETYCFICGAPCCDSVAYWVGKANYSRDALSNQISFLDLPSKLFNSYLKTRKYKWIEKCIFFDKSKNIMVNAYDSSDGEFVDTTGMIHNIGNNNIAHRDCYSVLKSKIGPFGHGDIMKKKMNYGIIGKYKTRKVNWGDLVKKISYVLESPLRNAQNRERILKLKHPIS